MPTAIIIAINSDQNIEESSLLAFIWPNKLAGPEFGQALSNKLYLVAVTSALVNIVLRRQFVLPQAISVDNN